MNLSDNPDGGWHDKGHAGKPAGNRRVDGILRDHTPAISASYEMKRWSGPHGDVGRPAEMTGPSPDDDIERQVTDPAKFLVG